jgi:hypothetical protein
MFLENHRYEVVFVLFTFYLLACSLPQSFSHFSLCRKSKFRAPNTRDGSAQQQQHHHNFSSSVFVVFASSLALSPLFVLFRKKNLARRSDTEHTPKRKRTHTAAHDSTTTTSEREERRILSIFLVPACVCEWLCKCVKVLARCRSLSPARSLVLALRNTTMHHRTFFFVARARSLTKTVVVLFFFLFPFLRSVLLSGYGATTMFFSLAAAACESRASRAGNNTPDDSIGNLKKKTQREREKERFFLSFV